MEDLKTEDKAAPVEHDTEGEPVVHYQRRRIAAGAAVLVRGTDDRGAVVTWVARVKKARGARGQRLRASGCRAPARLRGALLLLKLGVRRAAAADGLACPLQRRRSTANAAS